jgi:hypothetical protein
MGIMVEIAPQELADLKRLTRLDGDADAVTAAAREFLRLSMVRELKSASGKVEFASNWEELEAIEVTESFPS